VALGAEAHNAEMRLDATTGEHLLFHIGTGSNAGKTVHGIACTNGSTASCVQCANAPRYVVVALLEGPRLLLEVWTRARIITSLGGCQFQAVADVNSYPPTAPHTPMHSIMTQVPTYRVEVLHQPNHHLPQSKRHPWQDDPPSFERPRRPVIAFR
jgi:hypothetical protein